MAKLFATKQISFWRILWTGECGCWTINTALVDVFSINCLVFAPQAGKQALMMWPLMCLINRKAFEITVKRDCWKGVTSHLPLICTCNGDRKRRRDNCYNCKDFAQLYRLNEKSWAVVRVVRNRDVIILKIILDFNTIMSFYWPSFVVEAQEIHLLFKLPIYLKDI